MSTFNLHPNNTAVVFLFRSKSPESNRHFLRVDNAATKNAIFEGYLTMSDASTGTGRFAYSSSYNPSLKSADKNKCKRNTKACLPIPLMNSMMQG